MVSGAEGVEMSEEEERETMEAHFSSPGGALEVQEAASEEAASEALAVACPVAGVPAGPGDP